MHFDVLPNAHADPRARIDAIDARLSAAPHAKPGREVLVHRPGQRQRAIHELVAAAHADDAGLEISVEQEMHRHRAFPQPAFEEQCESASPAAILTDPLAPLGRDPDGNAAKRLDPNAAGDFAAATADVRTAAERGGDLAREVVEQA